MGLWQDASAFADTIQATAEVLYFRSAEIVTEKALIEKTDDNRTFIS